MSLYEFDNILRKLIQETIEENVINGKVLDGEKLETAIKELYSKEKIYEYADPIYQSLKETGPTMVEEERLETQGFESRLQLRWLPALYDLSSLIKISEETAGDIIDDNIESWAEAENDRYFVTLLFDVLMKIYSKAIVVSKEINTLLKSGFADGAMSRWRSLHECNIYFSILTLNYTDKGLTEDIIQKFIDFSKVESFQELNKYRKKDSEFKIDKIASESIKKDYDEVLNKYGENFRHPYSWAKDLFPNKKKIYFSDLEKKAGINHLSIYYKEANYHIHASPTGLYNSLGNIQHEKVKKVGYLLGPSNYGLSIPGQLTLISLAQISISLLLLEPSLDKLIRANIFQRYVDEATVKFDEIQQEIEREVLEADI